MGDVVHGRSTLQIAEDMLVELTKPRYNVTRDEAVRLRVIRRELGSEERQEAEELLLNWEGGKADIDKVDDLYRRKHFAIYQQSQTAFRES